MKHTPPPWTFVRGKSYVMAGDEQEWEIVAQVPNPDNGPVVAAAPGLLAVAEELLRLSDTFYIPGDTLDRLRFWVDQATERRDS